MDTHVSFLSEICILIEEENYQQNATTRKVCRQRQKFPSLEMGTGLERGQHRVGKQEIENGEEMALGGEGAFGTLQMFF